MMLHGFLLLRDFLQGLVVVASSVADSPGCLAGADACRQARLEAPNNTFRAELRDGLGHERPAAPAGAALMKKRKL